MIPLQFSFEAERYHFSLLEYGRAHRRIWIEVSSEGPTYDQQQHQYLYLSRTLYLPWATGWISPQPYIASHEALWQFAQVHPRLIKQIFDPIEETKNNPELAEFTDELIEYFKLFVFPCEDEPVYIVASHPRLQHRSPYETKKAE